MASRGIGSRLDAVHRRGRRREFRADPRRERVQPTGMDENNRKQPFCRSFVAEGVRGSFRRAVDGTGHPIGAGAVPASNRFDQPPRSRSRRTDDHRARERSSKRALPAEDPLGGRDLVPALQRAGLRIGPGVAVHTGSARRRRMGRERPESLDLDRPVLRVRDAARP